MAEQSRPPRLSNQMERTRSAIVAAARDLADSGAEITMPAVAAEARVSEATAYRYFPDLITLLQESLEGAWPEPAEALAPIAKSADPAARVAYACWYLLDGVHTYQGAVRAMISHTITEPAAARTRPGIRFGLIDYALAPFEGRRGLADGPVLGPGAMDRLKQELAVVVSAEAFFVLTDLCGLAPVDAIQAAARTAATLTRAAFAA
jgi:AcrR family transcriptional regulator